LSEHIPERADVRQLRTQAKELLRALKTGETVVEGIQASKVKLADAQLLLARQYGFDSWPKLIAELETPGLLAQLKSALEAGNLEEVERLLLTHRTLRQRLNDAMFYFDQPPLVWATRQPNAAQLLPLLVRFGANPNGRSTWWAGGFSALDQAHGETVEVLLDLGARFDVWSAAKHNQLDVLRALLDRDPSLVNARGGDGETPLHFAATPEIAEFLIERGAELEMRDIDHESTPIQYQVNNLDVVRVLLRNGAKPDIYTAVVLDDLAMARQLIAEDPEAANAQIGVDPYVTKESTGGHIYAYLLGPRKSAYQVAAERKRQAVLKELVQYLSLGRRLILAAWLEDAETVRTMLREHPELAESWGPEQQAISHAAQAGKVETVRLLLEAGLDPTTPGMDSGSALHVACWFGWIEVVKLLVDRVPLDLLDAHHGSPPLGWATHGAHNSGNKAGDYPGVVEVLLLAGADARAPANSGGTSMLAQAGNREDVKEVLRRFGAE
jgi:ankyrin repeat protein